MLTLNQFSDLLKAMVAGHNQLKTYGEGDHWEIGASTPIQYPLLWLVPQPFATKGSPNGAWEATTKYSLIFADIMQADKSNEQEVLSDMQAAAFDILAWLKSPAYDNNFILDPAIQFTPFNEKFDDLTAGWKVDILIRVNFLADRCAVPGSFVPVELTPLSQT